MSVNRRPIIKHIHGINPTNIEDTLQLWTVGKREMRLAANNGWRERECKQQKPCFLAHCTDFNCQQTYHYYYEFIYYVPFTVSISLFSSNRCIFPLLFVRYEISISFEEKHTLLARAIIFNCDYFMCYCVFLFSLETIIIIIMSRFKYKLNDCTFFSWKNKNGKLQANVMKTTIKLK